MKEAYRIPTVETVLLSETDVVLFSGLNTPVTDAPDEGWGELTPLEPSIK